MQHGHQVYGFIITTLMFTTCKVHTWQGQCLTRLFANKTLDKQIHPLQASLHKYNLLYG